MARGIFGTIARGANSRSGSESMDDPRMWQDSVFSTPSVTGVAVNQQSALSASAVLACVTMLAEDVAKLPWSVNQRLDDGSKVEDRAHYLSDLLQEPNDWQNGLEYREQKQISLVLRGNAYSVIVRDRRGYPIKLVPINADWVALWEAPDGGLFYRVTPQGLHLRSELAGQPFLIPDGDMLHIRGFSLNGLLGVSRISVAREAIGLSIAQEQQAARWMGNSAKPSGILMTDQKLSPGAAERMSSDWRTMFGGLQNSGKTAVLEQGVKFSALEMTSADLEFIASRKFQLEDVVRIFRVPMHMVGILDRSTNNNIGQQSQEYVNYTLTGYTNRWSRKIESTFGLWRDGRSIDFDYRELTTADMTARVNNWRTMIMSMMATPDEARIDLGMRPEGGEAAKLHFPQNMAASGSQSTGTAPDDAGRPSKQESAARGPAVTAAKAAAAPRHGHDDVALEEISRRLRAAGGSSFLRDKEYVYG
jgi:HK97 family phage portal protein